MAVEHRGKTQAGSGVRIGRMSWSRVSVLVALQFVWIATTSSAQTPPNQSEIESYSGLHRAAFHGDVESINKFAASGADIESRDRVGRTPLHVAAFASQDDAVRALAEAGADLNALERQAYDIVTIAAVANDLELVNLALSLGASAGNITSPYEGTALIAAAHLGYYRVVRRLIRSGAPLDHINNLGWTALMEAVVLGDGGPNHVKTVRALVDAGADKNIPDRQGISSLEHSRARAYLEVTAILEVSR